MIWNPWKEIKRLRAELGYRRVVVADCAYYANRLIVAEDALEAIVKLETPRCSRGVQKAVNIAREALK